MASPVERGQAASDIGERLGVPELLVPCLQLVGKERGVAGEIAHLDGRPSLLCRPQLGDPDEEEAPQRGEALGVPRVASTCGSGLARQQGEVRRECGVDEG